MVVEDEILVHVTGDNDESLLQRTIGVEKPMTDLMLALDGIGNFQQNKPKETEDITSLENQSCQQFVYT